MRGNSSYGEAVMRVVRPDWTREIGMKMWSLGTDKSLVLITSPSRDKGMATLMREKEIWNWQPSIERVIKLPPSMMMQSWMGSDFTNDDLVKQSSIVNDYTHKILKDTTIDGFECYMIELIPKENAPVVWGKIISCISKKDYFQLLVKFYDEDAYLVNTMYSSKIKMMGGRLIPSYMEMTPAENPKQKTIFEYSKLEFDLELDDSFFSLQNIKRVR
jgi:outer membrane lipoprotein-sorting protein